MEQWYEKCITFSVKFLIFYDNDLFDSAQISITAWKVSKYGVIFDPYFPVFGLNTERFSPNTGKYGSEITPYLDNFHAV